MPADLHCDSNVRWLMRTCRLLVDNDWPSDQPLAFNGSGFRDNYRDEASRTFFHAVLRNGKGKTLNLKNTTLDLKSRMSLEELLSSNKDLQKLTLCNVSIDDQSRYLPDSLFENNTNNIQKLRIEKCKIDSKVAFALANMTQSASLKSLKLVNVDLSSDTMGIFDGIAHDDCSLCHLELREVRMDEKTLSFLFESLTKNKTLKSLYLDDCSIGSKNAVKLADFLATNEQLVTLSLCDNDLNGQSIGILSERGLQHNTTLRKLLLSQNPIGDSGAMCLSKLLCSNPSIESLSLVDCEIWGPGCISLARGLAQMRGLKQLVVDGEWEDHVGIVLESMESNFTLVQLWTDRTPMLICKDDQWKKFEFYLRLNRAKRRMLVEPLVPASLWPRVLAGSDDDASIVYHMLRHKPDLASGN